MPRVNSLIVSDPRPTLIVAGRGSSDVPQVDGVRTLGEVEHVGEFYSLVDLVVVPRLGDSTGVSVKLLEAVELGVPVVAPTKLVSDAGISDGVLVADSVEETARAIADFFEGRTCLRSGSSTTYSHDISSLIAQREV